MEYVIDVKSHTPAYRQLYLQVREDIIKGIYHCWNEPRYISELHTALREIGIDIENKAIAAKIFVDDNKYRIWGFRFFNADVRMSEFADDMSRL